MDDHRASDRSLPCHFRFDPLTLLLASDIEYRTWNEPQMQLNGWILWRWLVVLFRAQPLSLLVLLARQRVVRVFTERLPV
jgi:hypothetical protein